MPIFIPVPFTGSITVVVCFLLHLGMLRQLTLSAASPGPMLSAVASLAVHLFPACHAGVRIEAPFGEHKHSENSTLFFLGLFHAVQRPVQVSVL